MPGLVGVVSGDEALHDRMVRAMMHETYRTDRYADVFFRCARVHLGTFNPGPQPVRKGDVLLFMDGKAYGPGSDPVSCLERYLKDGPGFVAGLNGSFVIVIYDIGKKKVIIANDRYGLRPLYYATVGGRLLFAPEVKAILEDRDGAWKIDDEGVLQFIASGKLIGRRTMFAGIAALPYGSILTFADGKASIERYWRYEYQDRTGLSEDELVDRLVSTFRSAVDARLEDGLRYGISLSGGLDSRAIVGAVPLEKARAVRAFTFGTAGNRESRLAQRVARTAGLECDFIALTPEILMKYAAEAISLSEGMDILIQGYSRHVFEVERAKVDVAMIGLGLDATLGGSFTYEDIMDAGNGEEAYARFMKRQYFIARDKIPLLFQPGFYDRVKGTMERDIRAEYDDGSEGLPANRACRFMLMNRMMRLVIMRSVLQRYKVEDALPTMDYGFIDVVLQVPPELRKDHYLYRKFLMRLSPELAKVPYQRTMVRPDAPMPVWKLGRLALRARNALRHRLRAVLGNDHQEYIDLDGFLSGDMKSFIRDLLLGPDTLSTRHYLNEGYVRKLVEENERGIKHSRDLVYLASFELFLRSFRQYVKDT